MIEVIDFWAPWCSPCIRMAPLVEKITKEYDGRAIIRKVNIDENTELTKQFNIKGVPTFLYLKDGVEVDRSVGVHPINIVREKINSLLR